MESDWLSKRGHFVLARNLRLVPFADVLSLGPTVIRHVIGSDPLSTALFTLFVTTRSESLHRLRLLADKHLLSFHGTN